MVNVGGRSRGCGPCRKRRVKCDETRPICKRCQIRNLVCDGPKDMTFIHAEPTGSKTAPTQAVSVADLQQRALSEVVLSEVVLAAPPRVAGFDVYICYTMAHLVPDGLMTSTIANIKAVDLVPSGAAVASRQVSHQAIMSFATLLFGIQHRQTDIATHGYAMHGVALKQLNQVLSDSTRYTSDQAIVAAAALAMTEGLMPSSPDNYLAHMMGLQRLVALQDPESFWSSRSPGFRKGTRFMLLFASLQSKKPSILARPEWKRAMRIGASYEQLQEQDLYDVLADCTVLLAERDAVLAARDGKVTGGDEREKEIQQRASYLLTYLHEWRARWDANLMDSSQDTPGSSSGTTESRSPRDGDHRKPLVAATTDSSVSAAVTLMLYNLALMYVFQIQAPPLHRAESAPRDADSHPTGTATGCHRAEELAAAREACRRVQDYLAVKRCLDPRAPEAVHWAIMASWKRLKRDDSVEGAWMRELLTGKGRKVFTEGGIVEHVQSFELVD